MTVENVCKINNTYVQAINPLQRVNAALMAAVFSV